MSVPRLSIIVPVYRDAIALKILINSLASQKDISFEIIVVEGLYQNDKESLKSDVFEIAKAGNCRYLSASLGRGHQMNMGRSIANAPMLLFLHADSEFSSPFQLRDAIQEIEKKELWCAGHFPLRFRSDSTPKSLAFLEYKSQTNRPYTVNGDQGLMISTFFFDEIDGFATEYSFLEDQNIAEKIRNMGTMILFAHPLITSPRRFEAEGFLRRYFLMMVIMGVYRTHNYSFFELAPPIYVTQEDAKLLDLSPFFGAIKELQSTMGFRSTLKMWLELGVFARENIWQVFLFGDFIFSQDEPQFLDLYDSFFDERLDNLFIDAVFAFGVFSGVTQTAPLLYNIIEKTKMSSKKFGAFRKKVPLFSPFSINLFRK